MQTFELSEIACAHCGAVQAASGFSASCPGCGGTDYSLEIERSASGLDGQDLVDALWKGGTMGGGSVGVFLDVATDDVEGPGLYFKTHSLLACTGVSGQELLEFRAAPVEDRRRMYVGWKRREIESHLPEGHRICGRCKVQFKEYPNEWNRGGFCSKSCHAAYLKSSREPR